MPTLPDYKILTADDPFTLQRLVVAHLVDGWETAGGVAHSVLDSKCAGPVRPGYELWSQAVVRREDWRD